MTYDFFMGQLRLAVIALISFATGKGWISTGDASSILNIIGPVALLAAPLLWSWSANWRKKYIPQDAVAIEPHTPQDAAAPIGASAAGKVIGALLFALLLPFLLADPVSAQIKLTGNPKADFANLGPKASTPDTAADSAVSDLGTQFRAITREIVTKAIADVTAASADAEKHNDMISKPCWDANLKLLQGLPSQWETPPETVGIALGIQIQRDIMNSITGNDATSLKVACAALWGDQLKIVGKVGALLGIRIATGGLL